MSRSAGPVRRQILGYEVRPVSDGHWSIWRDGRWRASLYFWAGRWKWHVGLANSGSETDEATAWARVARALEAGQ